MNMYTVVVSNVGVVHEGNNPIDARAIYGIYLGQSKNGFGRAGGESVALLRNNEPFLEYTPITRTRNC